MKKSIIFAKRNLTEMLRDPLLYIFCLLFPLAMIILFQIIGKYAGEAGKAFELKTLIPGIMMFSYTFLMLMASLLISKDRATTFLKRLFTSPLKPFQFILGYFFPLFIIGILQSVVCIISGYLFGINNGGFTSFLNALLLFISMLPIMVTNIMLGILFGSLLNDKSAPAVTSIFISLAGILGGAWMPVETMGNFETFVSYLPFYPAVYIGRIATKAIHITNNTIYQFDTKCVLFIIIEFVYLVISILTAIIVFKKKMSSDRN